MAIFVTFSGIGYACAVVVFLLNCEYNIILTWAFYYLFSSFTSVLPWSNCDNEWNTPECHVDHRQISKSVNNATTENATMTYSNMSVFASTVSSLSAVASNVTNSAKITDPVTEYWEYVFHLYLLFYILLSFTLYIFVVYISYLDIFDFFKHVLPTFL
jgi:hypothetical protein